LKTASFQQNLKQKILVIDIESMIKCCDRKKKHARVISFGSLPNKSNLTGFGIKQVKQDG
jgi:hypothetical protein